MKRTLDSLLEGFFPDPKTRANAKKVIAFLLVAGILTVVFPQFAIAIKLVAAIMFAIFIIAKIEEGHKDEEINDKSNIVDFKRKKRRK